MIVADCKDFLRSEDVSFSSRLWRHSTCYYILVRSSGMPKGECEHANRKVLALILTQIIF